MALDTYANLRAAIATRLHRSDLTASIVDYITLAEKRLNRKVQLIEQETETTLTAVIGSRNLTLPSLFAAPIALYCTTYLPRVELAYRLPKDMQVYSSNGPSSLWTVDGSVIKTNTPADKAYTYTFRYLAAFDLASTSTNTLLTNYPDTYFYGALLEASIDLKDKDGIALNQVRFDQAIDECLSDSASTRSIAQLTTELSGTGGRSNIIRGF